MIRSDDLKDSVTDRNCAVQHSRAPRPLPLFLELVRLVSQEEPDIAAGALEGLARYEGTPRTGSGPERPVIARRGPAILRDCGGSGPPAVLVPSLINPPYVLDLDGQVSLACAIAKMGRRALLLDWGEARDRDLDLGGHVAGLLVPLLAGLEEPPALVGYCLGGTMALAAANLTPVERVATLAAPWSFSAYPADSRESLKRLWQAAKPMAERLGALPMEVLQSAFWSLDPRRTVAKFARFADLPHDSDQAHRFVMLEDWANEGEPLPLPAARELIEELFGENRSGAGAWIVGGRTISDAIGCPVLHFTASGDRITPESSAPAGEKVQIDAGHVGMVVGSARASLHQALGRFLG